MRDAFGDVAILIALCMQRFFRADRYADLFVDHAMGAAIDALNSLTCTFEAPCYAIVLGGEEVVASVVQRSSARGNR